MNSIQFYGNKVQVSKEIEIEKGRNYKGKYKMT